MINQLEVTNSVFCDLDTVMISHNDLDGIGPVIVGTHYFNNFRYFNVSNKAVNKMVWKVLLDPEYSSAKLILITDCSVDEEKLIDYIEEENKSGRRKILLFDHHDSALELNKYEWAEVTQEEGVSGTLLFFKYMKQKLKDRLHMEVFAKLSYLVKKISNYDTWVWEKIGDIECKQLSSLFRNTGPNYFVEKYSEKNWYKYKPQEIFLKEDLLFLEDLEIKFKYIIFPAVERSARVIDFSFMYKNEHNEDIYFLKPVKCVTVQSDIGDMAEKLYEDGIDTVACFYHDSISIRSRDPELHLGMWAKNWGGGGHKGSAGFYLNKNNFHIYMNYLKLKFNQ